MMDKPAYFFVETRYIASPRCISNLKIGQGLLFDARACMGGDAMYRVSTSQKTILPFLF